LKTVVCFTARPVAQRITAGREPGANVDLANRPEVRDTPAALMQGGTGSKTGGDQSEKGDVKRAHRDATMISRMLGTFALSARTEFSVTTGVSATRRE